MAEHMNEPEMPEVETLILTIRGRRVILDSDLAALYGVSTKRLNQQVRRNQKRFPDDFVFKLTVTEKDELVANCDRFNHIKHLSGLPLVFTEFGAIQAANVLRSSRAIEMSVLVVRAFVRMRELVAMHKDMMRKIETLENKYDRQFKAVFDAIRQLMSPPPPTRKRIGF
jgi:hypothetical protein